MEVFSTIEKARRSDERSAYIASRHEYKLFSAFGSPDGPIHFDVTVPAGITELPSIDDDVAVHHFKPIPAVLMAHIIAIFRTVYNRHQTEMIVLLKWDPVEGYHIDRPKCACVGHAYLKYRQDGHNIGTVHSHGNFGAGFSSIDDAFELGQPGIFMVVGNVKDTHPGIVASITGNGKRFHLDVPEIPEGYLYDEISEEEYEWWMEKIQVLEQVQGRRDGFFLIDDQGDILHWFETEEEANEMAEPGFSVVRGIDKDRIQAEIRRKYREVQSRISEPEKKKKKRKRRKKKKKGGRETNLAPRLHQLTLHRGEDALNWPGKILDALLRLDGWEELFQEALDTVDQRTLESIATRLMFFVEAVLLDEEPEEDHGEDINETLIGFGEVPPDRNVDRWSQ